MKKNKDWRIRSQKKYLNGLILIKSNYEKKSGNWEHDHCEFCWRKFISTKDIGYTTKNKYYWICEECFNDFKDIFNWELLS